jgi:hypothetical protein
MPATWEVKITPIDVARKSASITATRTDGEDVRVFSIMTALLTNPAQKLEVLNDIWQQFQRDKTKRAAIEAYLGGIEATAKTNLEAREI